MGRERVGMERERGREGKREGERERESETADEHNQFVSIYRISSVQSIRQKGEWKRMQ